MVISNNLYWCRCVKCVVGNMIIVYFFSDVNQMVRNSQSKVVEVLKAENKIDGKQGGVKCKRQFKEVQSDCQQM